MAGYPLRAKKPSFPGLGLAWRRFGTKGGVAGLARMKSVAPIRYARIFGRKRSSATVVGTATFAALTTLLAAGPTFSQPVNGTPLADCQTGPADPQGEQPDTWAQKLEKCGGVLIPPRTGDHELVEPAPPTGKTRTIEPRELAPDQGPVQDTQQ